MILLSLPILQKLNLKQTCLKQKINDGTLIGVEPQRLMATLIASRILPIGFLLVIKFFLKSKAVFKELCEFALRHWWM